ncbi:MAG: hypothetical protein ACRDWT_17405 [Jatrophihabitantaceae bacterium]
MGKHSAGKGAPLNQHAAQPSPEQPPADWIEQPADAAQGSEPDDSMSEADHLEADSTDVVEQSKPLRDDDPYPHD